MLVDPLSGAGRHARDEPERDGRADAVEVAPHGCRQVADARVDRQGHGVAKQSRKVTHALAIARWEDNSRGWLRGGFYGLASKKQRLQGLVGDGGTLWIVVSRRHPGGRSYAVSFRLERCRTVEYTRSRFGKHGVEGDPTRSLFFSSGDARRLLLRAYPKTPAARNVIQAQARCRKAS